MMIPAENKVRLLDSHTINQIAAGEVVERPAYALKELIENSLDAGATKIDIELEKAGKEKIMVRDNGCGMNLDNAKMALQRHATSKIKGIQDLETIRSFGFRGEAMPSLAAISNMILITGDKDGLRHKLTLEAGQIVKTEVVAGPTGTEILLENLFYNTPARLKFLRTDTTELAGCIEVVSKYIFSYPEVSFKLTHGHRGILKSSGKGNLLTAIGEVWGREIAMALAEIQQEIGGIKIQGYISPPHLTKTTRAQQWMFINKRPVRSKTLFAALDNAIKSLLPDKRHPIAVLMIDIDPQKIDVNVSPTKTEVKFSNDRQVFEAVKYSLKCALIEHGMIPSIGDIIHANLAKQEEPKKDLKTKNNPPENKQISPETLRELKGSSNENANDKPKKLNWKDFSQNNSLSINEKKVNALAEKAQAPLFSNETVILRPDAQPTLKAQKYPFEEVLKDFRIIGQLMKTFIVGENQKGLILIDQHVAHERILYEQLWKQRSQNVIAQQVLLTPEPLHLDKVSSELIMERLTDLKDAGFNLDPFGGGCFLIRAIPAEIKNQNPAKLLHEIIEEMLRSSYEKEPLSPREKVWIMASCKLAVKAGDVLSVPEMEQLINQLAQTENPYLCPHGRPITATLHQEDLWKKFKRT